MLDNLNDLLPVTFFIIGQTRYPGNKMNPPSWVINPQTQLPGGHLYTPQLKHFLELEHYKRYGKPLIWDDVTIGYFNIKLAPLLNATANASDAAVAIGADEVVQQKGVNIAVSADPRDIKKAGGIVPHLKRSGLNAARQVYDISVDLNRDLEKSVLDVMLRGEGYDEDSNIGRIGRLKKQVNPKIRAQLDQEEIAKHNNAFGIRGTVPVSDNILQSIGPMQLKWDKVAGRITSKDADGNEVIDRKGILLAGAEGMFGYRMNLDLANKASGFVDQSLSAMGAQGAAAEVRKQYMSNIASFTAFNSVGTPEHDMYIEDLRGPDGKKIIDTIAANPNTRESKIMLSAINDAQNNRKVNQTRILDADGNPTDNYKTVLGVTTGGGYFLEAGKKYTLKASLDPITNGKANAYKAFLIEDALNNGTVDVNSKLGKFLTAGAKSDEVQKMLNDDFLQGISLNKVRQAAGFFNRDSNYMYKDGTTLPNGKDRFQVYRGKDFRQLDNNFALSTYLGMLGEKSWDVPSARAFGNLVVFKTNDDGEILGKNGEIFSFLNDGTVINKDTGISIERHNLVKKAQLNTDVYKQLKMKVNGLSQTDLEKIAFTMDTAFTLLQQRIPGIPTEAYLRNELYDVFNTFKDDTIFRKEFASGTFSEQALFGVRTAFGGLLYNGKETGAVLEDKMYSDLYGYEDVIAKEVSELLTLGTENAITEVKGNLTKLKDLIDSGELTDLEDVSRIKEMMKAEEVKLLDINQAKNYSQKYKDQVFMSLDNASRVTRYTEIGRSTAAYRELIDSVNRGNYFRTFLIMRKYNDFVKDYLPPLYHLQDQIDEINLGRGRKVKDVFNAASVYKDKFQYELGVAGPMGYFDGKAKFLAIPLLPLLENNTYLYHHDFAEAAKSAYDISAKNAKTGTFKIETGMGGGVQDFLGGTKFKGSKTFENLRDSTEAYDKGNFFNFNKPAIKLKAKDFIGYEDFFEQLDMFSFGALKMKQIDPSFFHGENMIEKTADKFNDIYTEWTNNRDSESMLQILDRLNVRSAPGKEFKAGENFFSSMETMKDHEGKDRKVLDIFISDEDYQKFANKLEEVFEMLGSKYSVVDGKDYFDFLYLVKGKGMVYRDPRSQAEEVGYQIVTHLPILNKAATVLSDIQTRVFDKVYKRVLPNSVKLIGGANAAGETGWLYNLITQPGASSTAGAKNIVEKFVASGAGRNLKRVLQPFAGIAKAILPSTITNAKLMNLAIGQVAFVLATVGKYGFKAIFNFLKLDMEGVQEAFKDLINDIFITPLKFLGRLLALVFGGCFFMVIAFTTLFANGVLNQNERPEKYELREYSDLYLDVDRVVGDVPLSSDTSNFTDFASGESTCGVDYPAEVKAVFATFTANPGNVNVRNASCHGNNITSQGKVRKHNGLDYSYYTGTQITAPFDDAEVTFATNTSGTAWINFLPEHPVYTGSTESKSQAYTSIENQKSYTSLYNYGYGNMATFSKTVGSYRIEVIYAHLSGVSVTPGQIVNSSTIIGKTGNNGNSLGSHLHYEIRINDTQINPCYVFKEAYGGTCPLTSCAGYDNNSQGNLCE